MLQQVVLNAANPMTLNIDQADPDEIVVITSITGLDPADVTLFTGDFARDGGYYQGRRSGQRNPVFNLKLNPDYKNDIEVSDIREMLYSMFYEPNGAYGDGLQVILKDDRKPDRYFIGYTEKMPSEIFSRETTAQISMIAVDPFLKSVDSVYVEETGGWSAVPVTYEGTARTGLVMDFLVKAPSSGMIVDINGHKMKLERDFPTINDQLIISTEVGNQAINHEGFGAMASLTADSEWLQLNKGVNTIQIGGDALGDGKVVMTHYEYRASWWGV